jgi:hypothetical protein
VPDGSTNDRSPGDPGDGEDLLALLAPSDPAARPRPGQRGRRPAQQGSSGSGAIGPDDAGAPAEADSAAPATGEIYPIGQPGADSSVAPISAAVAPAPYAPDQHSAPPPTPPVIHTAPPAGGTSAPADRFTPPSDAAAPPPVAPPARESAAPAAWVAPPGATPVVGEPEPVVPASRTAPAPARSWALPPSAQAVARSAPAVSPDAVESESALGWTAPPSPSVPTFEPTFEPPSVQPGGQPAETMAGFGVGRWFQPLPGTPPVAAADGVPGPGARMVVAGGTPVHAIAAGTISAGPGGAMKLHTDEGLHIHYAGLAAASRTTTPGSRVAAGSILGAVAGAHGRTTRGELVLDVRDPTGEPVDAVRLLLGLPDPNELGFAAVGGGLGVDPDDLDRMLGDARSTP